MRGYLFEAATVALSRVPRPCAPVAWAKALAKRVGLSKARVALARKLAVTLFTMWRKKPALPLARSVAGSAACGGDVMEM